jgi:hypothetical protein
MMGLDLYTNLSIIYWAKIMRPILIKDEKIHKVDRVGINKHYKNAVWEMILDISNYRPSSDYFEKEILICAWCEKHITEPSSPDHFLLWTKDDSHYICVHFRYAFEKGNADAVNKLLDKFDYKAPI